MPPCCKKVEYNIILVTTMADIISRQEVILGNLPHDILFSIMDKLDLDSLCNLSQTSKHFLGLYDQYRHTQCVQFTVNKINVAKKIAEVFPKSRIQIRGAINKEGLDELCLIGINNQITHFAVDFFDNNSIELDGDLFPSLIGISLGQANIDVDQLEQLGPNFVPKFNLVNVNHVNLICLSFIKIQIDLSIISNADEIYLMRCENFSNFSSLGKQTILKIINYRGKQIDDISNLAKVKILTLFDINFGPEANINNFECDLLDLAAIDKLLINGDQNTIGHSLLNGSYLGNIKRLNYSGKYIHNSRQFNNISRLKLIKCKFMEEYILFKDNQYLSLEKCSFQKLTIPVIEVSNIGSIDVIGYLPTSILGQLSINNLVRYILNASLFMLSYKGRYINKILNESDNICLNITHLVKKPSSDLSSRRFRNIRLIKRERNEYQEFENIKNMCKFSDLVVDSDKIFVRHSSKCKVGGKYICRK